MRLDNLNKNLQGFVDEFNEVTNDCQKFCFMARAKEFQQEAIRKLDRLKEKASSLKQTSIDLADEDSANLLLSLEEMIEALCCELRMWIALKEENPNSAWDYLIMAEGAARTALQSHSAVNELEGYVHRLRLLEKLLFPPQIFMSPGIVIEESKCSICGEEYGECNHLRGTAYLGRMCARHVTKARIREGSIVQDPANRHARVYQFTEGGITRDMMTWHVIDETPDQDRTR